MLDIEYRFITCGGDDAVPGIPHLLSTLAVKKKSVQQIDVYPVCGIKENLSNLSDRVVAERGV